MSALDPADLDRRRCGRAACRSMFGAGRDLPGQLVGRRAARVLAEAPRAGRRAGPGTARPAATSCRPRARAGAAVSRRHSCATRRSTPASWRSPASTVLATTIATVIGPTPPGTGVSAPATRGHRRGLDVAGEARAVRARASATRWMPTSTTVAPGLHPVGGHDTRAGRSRPPAGRPRAPARWSAGPLALWPSVTVMSTPLLDSSVASGRPTMLLRPSTTAWRPASGTS